MEKRGNEFWPALNVAAATTVRNANPAKRPSDQGNLSLALSLAL